MRVCVVCRQPPLLCKSLFWVVLPQQERRNKNGKNCLVSFYTANMGGVLSVVVKDDLFGAAARRAERRELGRLLLLGRPRRVQRLGATTASIAAATAAAAAAT